MLSASKLSPRLLEVITDHGNMVDGQQLLVYSSLNREHSNEPRWQCKVLHGVIAVSLVMNGERPPQ